MKKNPIHAKLYVDVIVNNNVFQYLPNNNSFFIRAKIYDKPGAIAAISTILKNFSISIKSLFQEQTNKKLFNIAGRIRLNEWRGEKQVEFIIDDISIN